MATFALKVSIDDSKYVIRGIDKGSSKKEILCILTKYKKREQLPELQSALSKINSSLSIIEVKKANKVDDTFKRRNNVPRHASRRKGSYKNVTRKIAFVEGCSDDVGVTNEEKQKSSLSKGSDANEEYVKYRKRPLLCRSQSLSEKDRRQGKCRLRERPKSFGAFDSSKLFQVDRAQLCGQNQIPNIHISQKLNKDNTEESLIESEKEKGKSNDGKTRRNEGQSLLRSKKHCDLKSKRQKIQLQQSKLQNWLDSLERSSIAYFIEDFETQNCNKVEKNRLSSAERAEIGANNQYACQLKQVKKRNCVESRECVESNEYAEAETDSGLPSLDYESSLDTISRDDRISLEQSCDEGKAKETQNDSGFDCSSLNDNKIDADISNDCLFGATAEHQCSESEKFQKPSIDGRSSASEIQQSKESHIEVNNGLKIRGTDLVNSEVSKQTEVECDRYTEVKRTIDKISKTDENLLHCELLISQLEFQMDILSENFDAIEDIDMEIEEMKMISELRETEEFLKAITKLSQYQREAQSEIMEELLYLDAKTKERQLKLQSLERKFIRQKFKCIPRHLTVSREKRIYSSDIIYTTGNELCGEISAYNIDNDTISLV